MHFWILMSTCESMKAHWETPTPIVIVTQHSTAHTSAHCTQRSCIYASPVQGGSPQWRPMGSSAAGRYHAQGTSVMEEDGGEHWLITPPTNLAGRESNRQPLGYKSDTLTAYPRLPCPALLPRLKLFLNEILFYTYWETEQNHN